MEVRNKYIRNKIIPMITKDIILPIIVTFIKVLIRLAQCGFKVAKSKSVFGGSNFSTSKFADKL